MTPEVAANGACPPELELTRAISIGPPPAVASHLATCERCAVLARKLAKPREIVRAAAPPARSPAAVEQTRTALLATLAVEHARRRHPVTRGRRFAPLAFAAAAAIVVLGWRLTTRRPSSQQPVPSAAVALGPPPSAAASPPAPQHEAARVEVRGSAIARKIAGDRATVARPLRAAPEPSPSPAESAFVDAWAAFRGGRFQDAALRFSEALRLDPGGPLAEDAAYWRAVAYARLAAPEGRIALVEFLRRYPRSPHAPDASTQLSRLGGTSPAR